MFLWWDAFICNDNSHESGRTSSTEPLTPPVYGSYAQNHTCTCMHAKSHNHIRHRPHTSTGMHAQKYTPVPYNTHSSALPKPQAKSSEVSKLIGALHIATKCGKRFVYMRMCAVCVLCVWVHKRECVGRCNCACVRAGDIAWVCVTEGAGAKAELWAASQTESAGKHSNTITPHRDHRHKTNTNKDRCAQRCMQEHTPPIFSCDTITSLLAPHLAHLQPVSYTCSLQLPIIIPYWHRWDQWWWSYFSASQHTVSRFKHKPWAHKTCLLSFCQTLFKIIFLLMNLGSVLALHYAWSYKVWFVFVSTL